MIESTKLLNEAVRHNGFEDWIENPAVEDIAFNAPDGRMWIFIHGKWEQHSIDLSFDDLREIAVLAGSVYKDEVGPLRPLHSTDLPDEGSGRRRIHVCMPPAMAPGKAAISIRRHETNIVELAEIRERYDWSKWNVWNPGRSARDWTRLLDVFDHSYPDEFYDEAVKARLNGVLAGPTGATKTTLGNTLGTAIDADDRIGIVEDAEEFDARQKNIIRLRHPSGATSADLVSPSKCIHALTRLRPDRIIVQELRDPDAAYAFYEAMLGHPGSYTGTHGFGPDGAVRRIFDLLKSSDTGKGVDRATVASWIDSTIDFIVPLRRERGRPKPIMESVWFVGDAERRKQKASDLL